MRPSWIYALVDPRTDAIRYVGKTVISVTARLRGHESKARSGRCTTPVGDWIRDLHHLGLRPYVKKLAVVADDWQRAERMWIARLRTAGHALLNIHAGGNGAHTRASLRPDLVPLLGKVSDVEIAAMAGLSREAISYHRRRLGVRAAPMNPERRRSGFRKGQTAHNKIQLSDDIIVSMGKRSDRDLARAAGTSRQVIRMRRLAMGIARVGEINRKIGTDHCNSKLTSEDVVRMREEYSAGGTSLKKLAKSFGVDQSTVHAIVRRETWRHVPC